MKTIIAGSRMCTDYELIKLAIQELQWKITGVVSGCARGIDKLGARWAKENDVPLYNFPAEWDKFGKSAGYRRNVDMAENAEALLAIWDGASRGTKHMINIARDKGLEVSIFYYKKKPWNK